MRPIRTVSVFPTLLTLGNLICGFFAIVVAARIEKPDPQINNLVVILTDTHNLMVSGWLIFLAMVFDGLDGYVARLTRTSSDFGAELDSLSDVVSFGVAPGFLLVKMCPQFTILHDQAVVDHRRRLCGLRGIAAGPVQRGNQRRRRAFAL